MRKSNIAHLNRQIPPKAHTPMYNWHKFWSRKTWNVVGEFVKTYAAKGQVVFDPFAGSGVVAMEALKIGRRAIICDLLPVATEIARLTIKPVSEAKLRAAFSRVESSVRRKILDLYKTKCRKCGYSLPFTCALWRDSKMVEVRYQCCPHCGDRREKQTPPSRDDVKLLDRLTHRDVEGWYPKNPLYYPDGQPFKEKQRFESLDDMFTKRNLQALAWLMEAIEQEPNRDLGDFLKIGFTSVVHLCGRLLAAGRPGYRPFSGVGWNQQSYWYASEYLEANVWDKFDNAINGKQGLLSAKVESNTYFKDVKFGKSCEDVLSGKADVYIHTGSSLKLMEKMPKKEVDYIFTDPPYDSSIQYGELAFLWVAWLKKADGYLDYILSNEVIHNDRQHKSFNVYHSLLSGAFTSMFEVLRPNRYLTVTFHNPTFKVRNATIRAGVLTGFELQKIHHQELARPSAKSLIQPFGSAQGDFYLRFWKPEDGERAETREVIDELRFSKIVVDTAIRVMAERGEPTPYTIIINAVDPELARRGYFSELQTGLDIKSVLQKHLKQEFELVPARLGGAEGQLWWFKNPAMVPHLESVPLTERVEKTVLLKLQQRGTVTFTDIWDAVSTEFPNALTSDSMSIRDALDVYGREIPGGTWMLKPDFATGAIEREHSKMIAILAEIGKARGHRIWVGRVEQGHAMPIFLNRTGKLGRYVSFREFNSLESVRNLREVQNIDLLWIADNRIVSLFEVEATTSMTSALVRGSNVAAGVPKFLVTPEEREAQLVRKMKTPMFSDAFTKGNWQVLYFRALGEEFLRHRGKTQVEELVDKKVVKLAHKRRNDQPTLFEHEERASGEAADW